MNKTFKLFVILFVSTIVFTQCKKDEKPTTDPNAVTGSFSVGSTSYNFKGAFGDKYGLDTSISAGYNIDLILYSEGLTVVFSGGAPDSVYGQGSSIYLETFTSNENSLADGTYAYSDTEPHPLFTYSDYSDVGSGDYTTFNITNQSITGGTYTISTLSDGRRNISFNLNLDNGQKITGNFSGPISYY